MPEPLCEAPAAAASHEDARCDRHPPDDRLITAPSVKVCGGARHLHPPNLSESRCSGASEALMRLAVPVPAVVMSHGGARRPEREPNQEQDQGRREPHDDRQSASRLLVVLDCPPGLESKASRIAIFCAPSVSPIASTPAST